MTPLQKTLKAAMEAKNMTQADLVRAMNSSSSTICLICNGNRNISLNMAAKLAKALDISIDSMVE